MMLPELAADALRNLARHKLRSFLTALGIIFGIASVVLMVGVGEGAKLAILRQISELGTRNIIINAKKPPEEQNTQKASQDYILRYGLTFHDEHQIESTVPTVEQVLPVHDVKSWIWFKSRRIDAKVRGVHPDYFEKLRLKPVLGRILSERDGEERKRVCVVRARLLREAKYVGDPLHLDLRVGSQYLRVVGVLPDFEFQSPNKLVLGIDDRALEIYVPFETVADRVGFTSYTSRQGSSEAERVELHQIVCTVTSEDKVMEAARCIQAILSKLHKKRDYEVTVPLEQLEQREKAQQVFNYVLPIIAGISLLVGGIGILNIMLASVTERTREIGIRRAIGASRADITTQFLMETVTLAATGGVFGILLGISFVSALRAFTDWQPAITPGSVALSMAVSCLTGIVFGIRPAQRAAAMDPIRALRHE